MQTIHIGIDPTCYWKDADTSEFRDRFGISALTPLIGTVSRLDEPKKGIAVLLRAASLLKQKGHDFRIMIVGDGDSKSQLLKLREQLGLEKEVLFLGFWDVLADILAKFDIFVLPSLSEGFPIVNLEAMASSLPVVSTNVGGVSEAIQDGTNGLLVPPGDENALADALVTILNQPSRINIMGQEGQRIVKKNFRKYSSMTQIFSNY